VNTYRAYPLTWLWTLCLLGVVSCTNPFAPKVLEGDILGDLLGDPTTIEGFYLRFQNAYQLRDTTLYGPLIHPNFTFTYRDPEQNVDITWGRSQEMNSTSLLFQQSSDIQLQWNNIITQFTNTTKTQSQIIRRFNLVIVLQGSDIFRTDGSTNFVLTRADSTATWQILSWRDESEI
jgi:hypothetical protein